MKIEEIIQAFNNIANRLSDPQQLDSIKLTQGQLALQFQPQLNMIAFNDLKTINDVIKPDFINNFEGKFIISVENPDERNLYNDVDDKDLYLLRQCIDKISDYICGCTGSETIVSREFVMIYIDSNYIVASDFTGVDEILGCKGKLMFDDQRNFLYYSLEEDNEPKGMQFLLE